jgi:hypothetical protein
MSQSLDFKPTFMDLKDTQDRAYYESLEKDMEKDFQKILHEIAMKEREEMEKIKQMELEKMEEIKQMELAKNQPSKEEMRQRRLKFYEK